MRRKERQVTDTEQICGVINRCKVLRLGLNAPGAPYVVPMNFGWALEDDLPVFYLHCAGEGRKLKLLRANPLVGFEMDGAHALKEGDSPCAYSYYYESIVGTGWVTFVKSAAEKARVLKRTLRHQTGRDMPVSEAQATSVTVLRLKAETLSCKRNPQQSAAREETL